MKSWKDYSMRIARSDAIAIANRDQNYVIHAARPLESPWVETACGRRMACVNQFSQDEDSATSCKTCRRVLGNG